MTTQTDPTMQVLDALRAGSTTTTEVQNATGLGKSTVASILRNLVAAGQVTKTAGAGKFSAATYTVADGSQTAVDNINTDGATDAPAPTADAPTGGVADVAAWMADARPVPEPTQEEIMAEEAAKKDKPKRGKKAAATEKVVKTGKCTHPGCPHPDMHKEGRSWLHNPIESDPMFVWDHTATARAVRVAAPKADGEAARRPKGGMGNEIVAFLQAHPDESFGPGAIAKGIGTQWSGTVGKQCEKLVESGHILKTAPSPGAKYQAA